LDTGNDGASVHGATLVVVSAMAPSGWGITLTSDGKCGHGDTEFLIDEQTDKFRSRRCAPAILTLLC